MAQAAAIAIPMIAGGTGGTVGAVQQKRLAKAQVEGAARSRDRTQAQLSERTGLEIQQVQRQAARLQSQQALSAIRRGVGLGGGTLDLARAADLNEATSIEVAATNLERQRVNLNQGVSSLQRSLVSPHPLLAGIMGSLGGMQTGLSIQQSMSDFKDREDAEKDRAAERGSS